MHIGILAVLIVLAIRLPRLARIAWTALTGFFVIDGAEIKVTDGDSITIRGRRCRIIGHDSPEWDQPQGPAAQRALRSIISGQCIVIPTRRDLYGRMLVHVVSSSGLAAWRMVKRGHGFADAWWLIPTMLLASRRGVGMWGTPGLVRPDIWRLGTKPRRPGRTYR